MKILLITFDKEMEKKIRDLLKDYQIITAKNGEEALLLNVTKDVDLIIYDALAGGIAEDDINKLYDEGFQNVPFIILMDDLFPIDPNNIKPKNKKIISREVEVDKLPQLIQEMVSSKPTAEEKKEEQPQEVTASSQPSEEKKEEQPAEATTEIDWDALMGGAPVSTEQKEEEKKEEQPLLEEVSISQPSAVQEKSKPSEGTEEISLQKRCLLVSFDMPLVEKIQQVLDDLCNLYIARSAKQALQKYGDKQFDVIIFDTISGVFAEKGIKDLYEKGGYKDSLYVLLLDEFAPIDVDKLPVRNLRTIKRESEIDLLPEIVESAPHITLEQALQEAAKSVETATVPAEEKVEEKPAEEKAEETVTVGEAKLETPPAVEEKKEEVPQKEEPKPTEIPQTTVVQQPQPVTQAVQTTTIPLEQLEKQIEKLVEQKINERVIPLIEELIRSKLSEIYVKAIAREIIEPQIDSGIIKEIVQEIAEPIVRETLEQLLS
jgi:DNA-binding NarL/FixJ family response regulator